MLTYTLYESNPKTRTAARGINTLDREPVQPREAVVFAGVVISTPVPGRDLIIRACNEAGGWRRSTDSPIKAAEDCMRATVVRHW